MQLLRLGPQGGPLPAGLCFPGLATSAPTASAHTAEQRAALVAQLLYAQQQAQQQQQQQQQQQAQQAQARARERVTCRWRAGRRRSQRLKNVTLLIRKFLAKAVSGQ